MMSKKAITSLILILINSCFAFSQSFPGKIGANLDGIGGIALEFPNVTLTANMWESVSSPGNNATIDSLGWPTEDFRVVVFDQRPINARNKSPQDPAKYVIDVSGTYTLSFNGQANITSWSDAPLAFQNQFYDSVSNTTTMDVVFPPGGGPNSGVVGNYGFLMLNFLQTNYSAGTGGVKNIRLMRPGYQHNNPQIFRTKFLNTLSQFSALRYMNVLNSNNSNLLYPAVQSWSDRSLTTNARYTKGMPWENVIALGNYTGRDLWINIPVDADSNYIAQLATLMNNKLRNDVNIYLEYSNEVWNGSFSQYQYNYDAVLQSAEDADIRASTQFDDRRRARRVAKQIIRAGKIFESVFGVTVSSRTRIRPVFAWQIGGWLPWYDDVLNWINSTYGAPKDFIFAIASAPYFNENNIAANSTPQQIVAGMSANSDSNLTRIQTLAQYADQWQIKHLQYEGGPDNGGGSTINISNRILANRIPDMKTAVIHNYNDNWFSAAANGTAPVGTNDLISYFVVSGNVSRYGCWGAIEDLNYFDSLTYAPKYDALCVLSGMCGNEPDITLVNPSNNTVFQTNSIVNITATASDPDGSINKVEFFVNDVFIGTDSIAPFALPWIAADTGVYAVLVKAIDNDGKYTFADPNLIEVVSGTSGQNNVNGLTSTFIYPNPASEYFNIIIPQFESVTNIEVNDIAGKVVMQTEMNTKEKRISLYDFQPGIYFISIMDKKANTIVRKLIVTD